MTCTFRERLWLETGPVSKDAALDTWHVLARVSGLVGKVECTYESTLPAVAVEAAGG